MTCVRCGYCCTTLAVIVPINPDLPPTEDNLQGIGFEGPQRCPHLVGDTPGAYSCSIHSKPWYRDLPCAAYNQGVDCRLGRYILAKRGKRS